MTPPKRQGKTKGSKSNMGQLPQESCGYHQVRNIIQPRPQLLPKICTSLKGPWDTYASMESRYGMEIPQVTCTKEPPSNKKA